MKYGFLKESVKNLAGISAATLNTDETNTRLWMAYNYAGQKIYDRFLWKYNIVEDTIAVGSSGIMTLPYASAMIPVYVLDGDGENVLGYSREQYLWNKKVSDSIGNRYHEITQTTEAENEATYTSASAPTTTTIQLGAGDALIASYVGMTVRIDNAYYFTVTAIDDVAHQITVDKAYNDIFGIYNGTSANVEFEPAGCLRIQFDGNYESSYTIGYSKRWIPAYNDADDTAIPAEFDSYLPSYVHTSYKILKSDNGEERQNAEVQAAKMLASIEKSIMKELQPPNQKTVQIRDPYGPAGSQSSNTVRGILGGNHRRYKENDRW